MPFVLAVGGLIGFVIGMVAWTRWWAIVDTPTSDAAHCFVGYNEVQGSVRPIVPPVRSPLTGATAVWWKYKVERYEKSGDNSTWRTKEHGTASAPFEIVDSTGAVLVVPADMSIHCSHSVTISERDLPPTLTFPHLRALANEQDSTFSIGRIAQFFGDHPDDPIASLNGRWRVVEDALLVGETVFATGDAVMRDDGVVGVVMTGAGDAKLSVRAGTEDGALRSARTQTLVGLGVGSAALIAAPAVAGAARVSTIAAIAIASVLFGGYLGRMFNRLVKVRQQAERAWSLIDVALAKRNDLIPSLLVVVQAAFAHERQLLTDLTAARVEGRLHKLPSASEVADVAGHAAAGTAATAQLMVLAEAYPDLKGQPNAAHLITELRRTEDHVAFARRFYNDAVEVLRTRRQSLPDKFLVGLARADDLEFLRFDAPADAPTLGLGRSAPSTLSSPPPPPPPSSPSRPLPPPN